MSVSDQTRKVLWTRAHDRCAFPGCDQALTVNEVDVSTGDGYVAVVGEQAHIRSSKRDGPRHDPEYASDKLDSYENLILLCSTHHTRIDANGGAGYDADTLIKMRTRHEQYQGRRDRIEKAVRAYLGAQYKADDKVLFEQVDLHGPSVDSMFVDVPFSSRPDARVAELMERIAAEYPGDLEATEGLDGQIVTGAAQALLHPDWSGSALLVGGPGQGKSTLLQYVCQFHRARRLGKDAYTGKQQQLAQLTDIARVPIRLDLRNYAMWASSEQRNSKSAKGQRKGNSKVKNQGPRWPSIEEYIAAEVHRHSGGHTFSLEDLGLVVSTGPVLLALDGLDEVANLKHREQTSEEIVATQARLEADAHDLVVLVATRPGGTTSALWSSEDFPTLYLRRLSQGLRLQYLQQWATVAKLSKEATDSLQRTFMDNQNVPHIRELASYPMQLAILLHLLYRRQLLPQQRTELYREYLKTFLDREQRENKEPLLTEERQVIEDIHAILGWHLQTHAEEGTSAGSITRQDLKKLLRDQLAGSEDGLRLAAKLFSALTTRVLCLVERDAGSFQFEVQSLREYFAARYIFENAPIKGRGNSRDDCLNALLQRPYWSNVCRFFVGMFSQGEVRGIRHNLRELSKGADLGVHPMLRSAAALFLDDRTYEGQKDEPISEVVDFILDGQGVVLAEDGLLDVSGTSLLLSERAGRAQAVSHLKGRLEQENESVVRGMVSTSLRRHATAEDDLAVWWWKRHESTWLWLETAAQLDVLGNLKPLQAASLGTLLSTVTSPAAWATELLVRGGYDGSADEVISIVKDEINDGAAEVTVGPDRTTPVARLIEGARVSQLRPALHGAIGKATNASTTRTRLRRTANGTLLASIVAATNELRRYPSAEAPASEWQARLVRVADAWGDGWVLRQAAATAPHGIDLRSIETAVRSSYGDLASVLATEVDSRLNRADVDWWHERYANAPDGLQKRHWIFSLLGCARQQVVVALADDLNLVVDALSPKHFRALRESLSAFSKLSVARKLNLHDPLRLNQVELSPRVLWLARVCVTDASIEQIDRRLVGQLETLLEPGMGDMRELIRVAGRNKAIKFEMLRGTRPALPVGGWASNIKLGRMRAGLPNEVLRTPEAWPGDLVQRAVEEISDRLSAGTKSIAQVAESDSWFREE